MYLETAVGPWLIPFIIIELVQDTTAVFDYIWAPTYNHWRQNNANMKARQIVVTIQLSFLIHAVI